MSTTYDTKIKATYNESVFHNLSVTGTESADSTTPRYVGENISFTAGTKVGYEFESFKITPNTVQNTSTVPGTVTFVMPDADVKVEALWKTKYAVTITGTISNNWTKYFNIGDKVTIAVGSTVVGAKWLGWEVDNPAYVKMGLPLTSQYFTFEVQNYGNVTFTAKWDYSEI